MNRYYWILGAFAALVALLAVGLGLNPRDVPSPLVGKPAPAFNLPVLATPEKTFGPQDMQGKVWLFNVWASWCVSCRAEHPILVEFSRKTDVPVIGLNYKDARADGLAWLSRFGDPYAASAFDGDGRVGIDFGVYGVPETFIIDRQGIVRFNHIAPLTPEVIRDRIEPLVRQLNT